MKSNFADSFSRLKFKINLVLVSLLFFMTFYFSIPLIKVIRNIHLSQNSFYEIIQFDGHVEYKRVDSLPPNWVTLDKISNKLQGAIIASEDGKFFFHPGYDIEQLQKVIDDNFVQKKKKLRGASTITQQLVKNLFLNKDRTFLRKSKELFYAIMIEKYVNKKKILEIYLNIIEYGENLYGIKQASNFYFKKDPLSLSARESAFLAMLLPSPKKYSKSFKLKILTPFASNMIDSILLKMKQNGIIGEEEYLGQLTASFSWENPYSSSDDFKKLHDENLFEDN